MVLELGRSLGKALGKPLIVRLMKNVTMMGGDSDDNLALGTGSLGGYARLMAKDVIDHD